MERGSEHRFLLAPHDGRSGDGALVLLLPVTIALVVVVNDYFGIPIENRRAVVGGRCLDRVSVEIGCHVGMVPANFLYPIRGDKSVVTRPPIAGLHDQISRGPRAVLS